MINRNEFDALVNRVEVLSGRVLDLEGKIHALTESQGGEIPSGMAPVSALAAEYGISTKKAEELARNTGVMLVKCKAGGYIAFEEKFRNSARQVLRGAKRKYGSAYWYHPLLGKFQMSGGIPE